MTATRTVPRSLSDDDFRRLLGQNVFVGEVLGHAARLEYEIDGLLTIYFARSDRFNATLELLLPELTFGRKLEIFRRLPLKHTKAYNEVLPALRAFQRLRNVVAHNWSIRLSKARELLTDSQIRAMFSKFPDTFTEAVRVIHRRLHRLQQSKAFGSEARKAAAEMETRSLIEIMSQHL